MKDGIQATNSDFWISSHSAPGINVLSSARFSQTGEQFDSSIEQDFRNENGESACGTLTVNPTAIRPADDSTDITVAQDGSVTFANFPSDRVIEVEIDF